MGTATRIGTAELRAVPLFRLMSDDVLLRVASLVCRLHVPAGAPLSRPDPDEETVVILVNGCAELRDGGLDGAVIETIGPGACVGDRGLLGTTERASVAVATTDVVIDQIRVADLRALVDDVPD